MTVKLSTHDYKNLPSAARVILRLWRYEFDAENHGKSHMPSIKPCKSGLVEVEAVIQQHNSGKPSEFVSYVITDRTLQQHIGGLDITAVDNPGKLFYRSKNTHGMVTGEAHVVAVIVRLTPSRKLLYDRLPIFTHEG